MNRQTKTKFPKLKIVTVDTFFRIEVCLLNCSISSLDMAKASQNSPNLLGLGISLYLFFETLKSLFQVIVKVYF